MCFLNLADWLAERRQNALRISRKKRGEDRQGWLEDASYFHRAEFSVRQLESATAEGEANCPLRMYIALKLLRAWNSGTAGYSADVVLVVNEWIDGGMKGPIRWPDNPFFAEWAAENGFSKVGEYIGFRFQAQLVESTRADMGRL